MHSQNLIQVAYFEQPIHYLITSYIPGSCEGLNTWTSPTRMLTVPQQSPVPSIWWPRFEPSSQYPFTNLRAYTILIL